MYKINSFGILFYAGKNSLDRITIHSLAFSTKNGWFNMCFLTKNDVEGSTFLPLLVVMAANRNNDIKPAIEKIV